MPPIECAHVMQTFFAGAPFGGPNNMDPPICRILECRCRKGQPKKWLSSVAGGQQGQTV